MANCYFELGPRRSEKVRTLFDLIASRYDLLNDMLSLGMHRRWKRRLANLARVGSGCRALDLCCGTGDVVLALADTGAEVVGLDFSEPMLAVARRRAARWSRRHPHLRHGAVIYQEGDALKTNFPDDAFDAVTISYGLRNLASVECGLAEMWRVARPGGRLLVLDFGRPKSVLWRKCYFTYLRCVVPVLGRLSTGGAQAYAYIVTSLDHYPAQAGVAAALRRLPVTNVRICDLLGGAMSIHYAEKAVTDSGSQVPPEQEAAEAAGESSARGLARRVVELRAPFVEVAVA